LCGTKAIVYKVLQLKSYQREKFATCMVTGLLELVRGLCGVEKKSQSKIKRDKMDFNSMSIFLDIFYFDDDFLMWAFGISMSKMFELEEISEKIMWFC